jgi:hypothetical protein
MTKKEKSTHGKYKLIIKRVNRLLKWRDVSLEGMLYEDFIMTGQIPEIQKDVKVIL